MLFNFYLYILSNKHTFYDLNIDLTILEIVALPIKLKVYIIKEPSPKKNDSFFKNYLSLN